MLHLYNAAVQDFATHAIPWFIIVQRLIPQLFWAPLETCCAVKGLGPGRPELFHGQWLEAAQDAANYSHPMPQICRLRARQETVPNHCSEGF